MGETDARAPRWRVGHGYDIHRTAPHRRLVLGGVEFAAEFGLEGHSDADCLTHAICDALLGAAGLPDIGHFFPNTDPAYRGIDSQILLERTAAAVRERGWRVGNVDATLIAEKPKIAPQLAAMRERLARSLGIAPDQVGLKATTNEGSDDIGAGRAIAAHAVCLLERA
jgi:2-C-methyl-D-erythritol 2,4-cyclodiphosphate synthase